MRPRVYLVIFALLMALAATGVYLRQRAKATEAAAANCDTPAPPPPPAEAPPKLPGFKVEAACGTGEAVAPAKGKAKQP